MKYAWLPRVRRLTHTLVGMPSVTQTQDEVRFAAHLHTLLAAHPYFQAHPDHVWVEPIGDDPYQRANVYALVRGTGRDTVVLAGHYDVVNVDNYGALAPWAFDPDALLPRLIAALRHRAASPADQLALHDLESGAYLPGRGALDMKSGLAAGIAVLYRWAEASQARQGTLLFVATPDEEATSCGMRAAVERLPALAQAWDVDVVAAINLDSEADAGNGTDGRAVFFGSVGKLLPAVYVVGRDTHAGTPFDGINATLLAGAITQRIECNPDLADRWASEVAPPPVCLQQIDLKDGYDVTTPPTAWCLYNVLTYHSSPAQVLERLQRVVHDALAAAVAQMHLHAIRYRDLGGHVGAIPDWQSLILTFAELKERALQQGGVAVAQRVEELTQRLTADPAYTLPQRSRHITELLWSASGLSGPAAVLGVASLYYPPVQLDTRVGHHRRLRASAARHVTTLAEECGMSIQVRPFFSGISDMSFLGRASAASDLAVLMANTPAWGACSHGAYQASQHLDVPVINIGPWGRDYHQRTERVNMPYSFEVVPELIWRVVNDLLT
jgi:arginine utilization protein RocB